MAVMTVAQLATQLGRPTTALLEQLQSAGVAKQSPDDALTETDKERLLDFLRTSHGTVVGSERKKITLTKKTSTEIKQADASGRARTIQVEVRKKRVFVKRDDVPAAEQQPSGPSAEDLDLQRREEEAQAQADAIRQQEAELAESRRVREEQERAAREAAEAAEAAARVRAAGFEIGNIDSTVIAQAPKLAPHIPAMCGVIAKTLGLAPNQVNVKAKTAEHLGPVGQGQSMEARAVVLLVANDGAAHHTLAAPG